MKTRIAFFMCIGLVLIGICGIGSFQKFDFKNDFTIGQKIDSLNGVYVFYNGNVSHVMGRNTTKDGYNLGLKYQCVEFVKRYYYEYFNHKKQYVSIGNNSTPTTRRITSETLFTLGILKQACESHKKD